MGIHCGRLCHSVFSRMLRKTVSEYKDALAEYKVTPKGILQIFIKQDIPADVLKKIFGEISRILYTLYLLIKELYFCN